MEYLENLILPPVTMVLLSHAREMEGERPRGTGCTILGEAIHLSVC